MSGLTAGTLTGSPFATGNVATTTTNGLMSAADKTELDLLAAPSSHVLARVTTPQTITHNTTTTVVFNTEAIDSKGEYNPASGIFTAAAAGYYQVDAFVQLDGAALAAASDTCTMTLLGGAYFNRNINGQWSNGVDSSAMTMACSTAMYLAIGETITAKVYHFSSTAASRDTSAGTGRCTLSISQITTTIVAAPAPAVVLSHVAATVSAPQAIASATPTTAVFNSEARDTKGEYNPATGIFTAVADGFYSVNFLVRLTGGALTVAGNTCAAIINGGTEFYRSMSGFWDNGVDASVMTLQGGTTFQLTAGQTIYISLYHTASDASARSTQDGHGYCSLSIDQLS